MLMSACHVRLLLELWVLVTPDREKSRQAKSRTMVGDRNSPTYPRFVPKINPLIMGPTVCPISIIVSRKPVEAPTNRLGAAPLLKHT
jgi:hypothetical protein